MEVIWASDYSFIIIQLYELGQVINISKSQFTHFKLRYWY